MLIELGPGEELHVISTNTNPITTEAMRQTAKFIMGMDPGVIESKALEQLEWGDGVSTTQAIIFTIAEVFTNAADQIDGTEEIRGAATDGSGDSHP